MKTSAAIALQTELGVPRNLALPMLQTVLERFQAEPGSAALSVDLAEDLQFPLAASVNVPVRLLLLRAERPDTFWFRLEAAAQPGVYPSFEGTLEALEAGVSASQLLLKGTYFVPMSGFGKGLDLTLLGGAAESSLRRFLRYIAAEVVRAVRSDQREHARAALHFHV